MSGIENSPEFIATGFLFGGLTGRLLENKGFFYCWFFVFRGSVSISTAFRRRRRRGHEDVEGNGADSHADRRRKRAESHAPPSRNPASESRSIGRRPERRKLRSPCPSPSSPTA